MRLSTKSVRARLLIGASVAVLAMSSGAALAQDREPITIAPQPLTTALQQFGSQASRQVMFSPGLIASKKTAGVNAATDEQLALAQLLQGTGLTFQREGDVYLIVDASDPQFGSAAGDGADQGTVQALIVTAQKREENIQDVPIAMSAFSQEDLTRSQVAGGPDLMTQVPNMTFTKTNFTSYSIQIRGIGTQAISATVDPAVAVAFNNTPFLANHFFEQEFYDLERVEVLRGPQGTLYGRNATAGVVNIISAKPKFHYEARLSADVANYGSSRLEGMINIPLAADDRIALRIAGSWTKRQGFVKNILTGEQTDGRNLWSTRVTLGMEPADWLKVNLIWEHFSENDDRLRSGKQLCHSDPGPSEVNGMPVTPSGSGIEFATSYFSQACLPSSLYSPDAFNTPNGFALPYYGPLGQEGSPVYVGLNPYVSQFQSRNLREIETHLKPDYEASADVGELQLTIDLPYKLSLTSETAFSADRTFSFEDFNRFDTTPGVFQPGGVAETGEATGHRFDLVDENGFFCDPQLGCTNRLAAGDLATARSRQFSQEFRVSSDFDGPFNFSLGANFLRFDTEIKYYVFINTLTAASAYLGINEQHHDGFPDPLWRSGITDNSVCATPRNFYGPVISDPNQVYLIGCNYVDPNDVHHLNDQGRNYFLSRNPYHLLSYSGFGEAYYNITPNLKFTAGLRWTVDQKQAPQIPSWLLAAQSYGTPTRKGINQEWREPTGRIALDWKPDLAFTDETLVYGSYVRGYKAGGANPPPPVVVMAHEVCPPFCQGDSVDYPSQVLAASLTHPETFKPEFVNAFEVGTKNTLLDGRMTVNLGAFYYDYRGYQISQIVDRAAVNLNFDAKVWGAELEADWRPLENLRLGLKGGYENTRLVDGSKAIDLMDRTAGTPGWILVRPFPTQSSNCVFPEALATTALVTFICTSYIVGIDPVTYLPYVPNPTVWKSRYGGGDIAPLPPELAGYAGFDPASANHGEGFTKDLSGNSLPNAPKFTATITADYTLPLPSDWLMTLHTDLYYQSEAWTRIFNTPGYDKLKAYNNINLAAIFTNEDRGWTVMAYIKNVLNRDSITGAFLNSDDTGLTTNVFLTEPRLYGLRVTKNWSDLPWARPAARPAGEPYPFTLELGGQHSRLGAPGEAIAPFGDAFVGPLDLRGVQDDGLFDRAEGRQMRLTYRPLGSPWHLSAGVRYGKARTGTVALQREAEAGPKACRGPLEGKYSIIGRILCEPGYVSPLTGTVKYDPANFLTPINRAGTTASSQESHLLVDFSVGKDAGLGMLGEGGSSLSAGVRFAEFKSTAMGDLTGIPDMHVPDGWDGLYQSTFHHDMASFNGDREFKGGGPTLSWEASRLLLGDKAAGHLEVDWTLTGGVLFGKQKTAIEGEEGSGYWTGRYSRYPENWTTYPHGWLNDFINPLPAVPMTPISIHRSKSATVPVLDLSLGLSYEVERFKIGAGYRWERYFNVLDAGYAERKQYDRTIDGPYFKIAVGFGG